MSLPNQILKIPELSHYFTDAQLSSIPQSVQIFRTGTFKDYFGSKIEIDESDLISFAENFDKKVRRVDIALDEGHDILGPASGWVKKIYTNNLNQELWAEIEFNNEGKAKIAGKEYRYLSPEWVFEYEDTETGNIFGPTILGIGLTNRPFLKDMSPLTFSEGRKQKMPKDTDTNKMAELESIKTQLAELSVKFSESQTKFQKLSTDHEAVIKKNLELIDKNANMEKTKTFDEKLKEGLVCEAQRNAFMKDDMTEFVKNQAKVNFEGKSISASEPGIKEPEEDVQETILKKAKVFMADEKISMSDAISMVLKEDKKLSKKYSELYN